MTRHCGTATAHAAAFVLLDCWRGTTNRDKAFLSRDGCKCGALTAPDLQDSLSFPRSTGRKYRAACVGARRASHAAVRYSVARCADADDLPVELQSLGECIDAKAARYLLARPALCAGRSHSRRRAAPTL